ncbi:MAG: Ig-like domain-containing protein [Alicyclobacillaceae bacterium]|nr:Ig-like domain-containing protein [Alicyclobacillaceae bacterium]
MTGAYDNQQITFLTGTNATGQSSGSSSGTAATGAGSNQPAQPDVTVTLAKELIRPGEPDAVTVSPAPAPGQTVTYQVEALKNGDASPAAVDANTGTFTAQVPGVYRVVATVNGVTSAENYADRVTVTGNPAVLTINPGSYALKAGSSPTTLYVEVSDQNQQFLPGETVTFLSDNPNVVSVSSSSATTNDNGVASVQLIPGQTGTAHITVTSGSVSSVVPVTVS